MKKLTSILLVLVGLLYPFAVYFGLEHISPRWFALLLACLWLWRLWLEPAKPGRVPLLAATLLFCAVLVLSNEQSVLRLYPVLINAVLGLVFWASLHHGMPIIERLARLQEPDLPASGVHYTRRVTQVWLGFFVVNGSTALLLSLYAPWHWWTLYNGLIAYLLMGTLMAVEWLIRQRVRSHA